MKSFGIRLVIKRIYDKDVNVGKNDDGLFKLMFA